MATLRSRLHKQLDPRVWYAPGMSLTNFCIVAAIVVAATLAVLETEPMLARSNWQMFQSANFAFGVFFLVEYGARVWTVAETDPGHPIRARLKFIVSPVALIDLATALSSFVTVVGFNAAPFRLVRVLRIVRLARFGPIAEAIHYLFEKVESRRYELFVTFGLALLTLLIGSMLLYWIEGPGQPERFGSIPRAMWWAVTTMTTLGHDEMYPVTVAGKIIGSILGLAGVAVITLPTGILAGAFSEGRADHKNAVPTGAETSGDERPPG